MISYTVVPQFVNAKLVPINPIKLGFMEVIPTVNWDYKATDNLVGVNGGKG